MIHCNPHCAIVARMQSIGSLPDRLRLAFGEDKPPTVAKKLTLRGHSITYQSIYKWLKGGLMDDDSIAAVCAEYDVRPEWLKFGSGPMRAVSERSRQIAEIVDALPPRQLELQLEFLRFTVDQSTELKVMENLPSYMAMIDRFIADMKKKRGETR